jgi:PAS domain S-box-containing protein
MRAAIDAGARADERRWLAAGLVVAAVTFVADVLIPLGVAAGVPHILVVLIGFRSRHPTALMVAACVATALTGAGALLSPSGIVTEYVVFNRLLTLLVIWTTALFLSQVKKSRTRAAEQGRELADMTRAIDQGAIVAITDQRGLITYANDQFVEISGFSREELIGADHRMVNSKFHSKEFIRGLWRTIAGGGIWRGEIRNRAKDGTIYWVDTTIVPFLDEGGKPYQYLAIRHDVTDRKRAGRLPENSPDREIIDTILERIDALNSKVQELLRYAHPRPPHRARMSILSLLIEIGEQLRNDPRFEQIDLRIDGKDVELAADAELLRDVFVNLIINSAQSMEGPGRIDVEVSSSGESCLVEVRDEGPGIPEEARQRIFEPFFSTRHSGTGLGLAIAKRVVEAHGGRLDIDSPDSGGTVAGVTLVL